MKPSEFHIINSSAILEICKEQTEAEYRKSNTKSLSATVSIELLVGFLNPSFFVVKNLSILKEVPLRAATPKGFSFKFSKLLNSFFYLFEAFQYMLINNVQMKQVGHFLNE